MINLKTILLHKKYISYSIYININNFKHKSLVMFIKDRSYNS